MMPQFISSNLSDNTSKTMNRISSRTLITTFYTQAICVPLSTAVFLLLFTSLLSTSLRAETVQRWQDSSGQWHFGDHAAAKGHASKPVLVKTPISVVKNDQAMATDQLSSKKVKARKIRKKSSATSQTTRQNDHCNELRQQLYNPTVKSKKTQRLQTLTARYEHECIAGHYYGS